MSKNQEKRKEINRISLQNAFKKELRELLDKYGASIVATSRGGAECSSSVELQVKLGESCFDVGSHDGNDFIPSVDRVVL